jgi:hypothetical protein
MSIYLGIAIILGCMLYAIYVLFTAMREGGFGYFGRRIVRAEQPFAFWFSIAVMILVLAFGAWILPYYLLALP